MANERSVETIIDLQLKSLGWIDYTKDKNKNVFKQEFKNKKLNKKENGRPDFVLYDGDKILAIIEAKRSNENLQKALNQAEKYANKSKCKIIFAYDGNILKSKYIPNNKPLFINNLEINDFLDKETLKKFIKTNSNNLETDILDISQSELINIFKQIDSLLKSSGVEAGSERFSNLSTLIFIKILNDTKNNEDWKMLRDGTNIIDYINKSIITNLNDKYENGIFSELTIPKKYENNLNKILLLLDKIDFKRIDTDVKGGAYEYFLSKYNAGSKDLAQYYTPRHLINFMTKFLNPRLKDKIYDPFCGTGGMLIVAFKYLLNKINNEIPNHDKKKYENQLKWKSLFGREFTKIASTAKMNMILIGDGHSNISRGDTFAETNEKEKYNLVLTNIPFGTETEPEFAECYGLNGKVKEKKFLGEPSALIHIVDSLIKNNGKAGIIVPTGVLYRVYKNDRTAREKLIKNGLRFIINLPPNVFLPYTPAQTSILFLDNNAKNIKKDFVSFFNLKDDGYTLDTKRKKKDVYNDFDKLDFEYNYLEDKFDKHDFIKYLKIDKIAKNKFNLYYEDYQNESPKLGNFAKYIKISEICNIFQGPAGTYMQQKKYSKKGDLKVYEQVHVINKDWHINKERYISHKYSDELQNGKFLVKENDILVSMSGTVGETFIFKNGEKGIISTALTIIRIKDKTFLPDFIDIIISNKNNKTWLKSKIKGTANKGIRLGNVKNIWIPQISIDMQKKIINDHIKINEEINSINVLKIKKIEERESYFEK